MNRPCFKGRPIASIKALARMLNIPPRRLRWASERADRLYRAMKPITKPDGSIRQTFNPADPLKDIQRRINRRLFSRVEFPGYLQGGIRDRDNPRHCQANARLHSRPRIVINLDIASFFPSITQRQVHDIWQNFFRFPPDIAEILTRLTTRNGRLPQGAPTSSYLANLVLWKHEPKLVTELNNKGIHYSRYVDDITLSSAYFLDNRQKADAIRRVRRLCSANGFEVKRNKQRLETSSQPMRVNNLLVNQGVTLPKEERDRIRAAVNACVRHSDTTHNSDEYRKLFNRTLGRLNWLRQFHRHEGDRLIRRLAAAPTEVRQAPFPSFPASATLQKMPERPE